MIDSVLEYFPENIKQRLQNYPNKEKIEEIRIRVNQNIAIKIGKIEVINYKISKQEIEEIFENICEKSVYSYTKQISEGFITIKGGNRVGIAGSAVIENGNIVTLNYISSLNFRISKQIKDVSRPLLKYILDIQNDTIFNTIIASPPGGGKTTIIRDLARIISNRNARNKFYAKNMRNC